MLGLEAVELRIGRRPTQRSTGTGTLRIDRLAPRRCIAFVDELLDRNVRKIRIAHEQRAIHESAAICLRQEVDGTCRIKSGARYVVSFKDIQCLDQRNTS